jgi:hypothetical protein
MWRKQNGITTAKSNASVIQVQRCYCLELEEKAPEGQLLRGWPVV